MIIKISETNKSLSVHGGVVLADELLGSFLLKERIVGSIPLPKIAQFNAFEKFKGLLLGFMTGADCLDDMALLRDAALQSSCEMFTAKTYGNFL